MASMRMLGMEKAEEWEQIVKSFERYDVYYLPGYVHAFELYGDGEAFLLYYEGEGLRGINVVMKRELPLSEANEEQKERLSAFCDISTPYGYGGFLFEGELNEMTRAQMKKTYEEFCFKQGIVSEFVRFHPVLDNAAEDDFLYPITMLGETVMIDTSSKDVIWKNFTSSNRNTIKKAYKCGVRVYWGRSPELFDKFPEIYDATMSKVNATDYYYFSKEFYDSILYDLKDNAMMFYAVREGEIIAMSIMMYGNGYMHYHLSASKREYQQFAPTNAILYEAACFAAANGMKGLHLGGGLGSHHDSLYEFKKRFNREEDKRFGIGRKIYNQAVYDELCSINHINKDEVGFFPQYRA